jgi:hypothetical protein
VNISNPINMPIVRAVRRNHAAEHATITLLSQRLSGTRLVARSTLGGFVVYGNVNAQTLRQAAEDALTRLQDGESRLAVHPNCGTNLVVGGILTALAALLTLGRRPRLERLPFLLLSTTFALIAAQPLGRLTQRYVTTSPNLDDAWVTSVRRLRPGVHKVTIAQGPMR